jgi:hypothetical protein
MYAHFRTFKSFLLYYKSKTCWGEGPTDDDMMNWTPKDFKKYCLSNDIMMIIPQTALPLL